MILETLSLVLCCSLFLSCRGFQRFNATVEFSLVPEFFGRNYTINLNLKFHDYIICIYLHYLNSHPYIYNQHISRLHLRWDVRDFRLGHSISSSLCLLKWIILNSLESSCIIITLSDVSMFLWFCCHMVPIMGIPDVKNGKFLTIHYTNDLSDSGVGQIANKVKFVWDKLYLRKSYCL